MSQTARVAVASRLHMFLRRKSNRLTDVVWMVADPGYAREVLRLVRAEGDAEMDAVAARFEELMPAASAAAADASADLRERVAPGAARDYIKTLR